RQPDGTVDVVGVVDGVSLSGDADQGGDADDATAPVVRLLGLVSLPAGRPPHLLVRRRLRRHAAHPHPAGRRARVTRADRSRDQGAGASISGVVFTVSGPFSVQTAYFDRYIETPAYSPLTLKA